MPEPPGTLRIDKWLWAARFFKTRALASRACELGRVHANSHQSKPARDLHVGDHLVIRNDAGEFHVEVLLLSEVRGPAAVAQTLYRESEESREQRRKLQEEARQLRQFEPLPQRKPSKRDRRLIHSFRNKA